MQKKQDYTPKYITLPHNPEINPKIINVLIVLILK